MFTKLAYTTLFVSDQDKALDFYTNVLGFEKRADNPAPGGGRFVAVGVPGQDLLVVLWPGTPGKPNASTGPVPGVCVLETADCRKVFTDLKARGVRFETPEPLTQPWGTIAVGTDLDGNRLQIVERPKT